MWGARSPTWFPLHHIYFPGWAPEELAQNQPNTRKQDPNLVHSLDCVNDRLWLLHFDKGLPVLLQRGRLELPFLALELDKGHGV